MADKSKAAKNSKDKRMAKGAKELVFVFDGTGGELAALVGPLEEHVRQVENTFSVKISRSGSQFRIIGSEADRALQTLSACAARIQAGENLAINDVQMIAVGGRNGIAEEPQEEGTALKTRRNGLRARTPNQKAYLEAMMRTDITFGVGPAGTGKTYLAVAAAVDAFERNSIERIILTRPAIEAGERLGFLPGDLAQKVDPYLRPLYDALFDLFGFDKTQRLLERQVIEIAPLAYMRGRTLNNAFVILDEAQNTTNEQMKMFLTRIGFGTRAVITGDPSQVDLPRGVKNGLSIATDVLKAVKGISIVHFTSQDVVRHPLVGAIVRAYAAAEAQEKKQQELQQAAAVAARQ